MHFIDALVNHLESSAVTEFFTRLISLDGEFDGMTTQQWLSESGFVEKLLTKLGKDYAEIHSDVSQGIIEIIGASPWGTPLMNRMISEDTVRLLLKIIIDPQNPTAFKYGMKVYNKILRGLSVAQEDNQDSDDDEDKAKLTKPDPLGPLEQLPAPVRVIAEFLPKFCELLKNPLSFSKILDQSRNSYEGFGFDRFMVLETIDVLLDLNYLAMNKLLLGSDLFVLALELIFQFPHNNFCHRAIETIFVKFLENSGPEAHLTFLSKTKLAEKLIVTDKQFQNPVTPAGKPAPLYRPYLHRIVYSIGEICEADRGAQLKGSLTEIEGWNDLLNFVKEERKKLETSSAAAKVEEEPAYFQPPTSLDVPDLDSNDAYEEGRDNDDEDLNLEDDQDMDSTNDADDYDADQAEILLTKQEIEASA